MGQTNLKKPHLWLKYIGLYKKSHGQIKDQYADLILSLWVGDARIDLLVTKLLTSPHQ